LSIRATHLERFEHHGAGLVDEVLGDDTSQHMVFLHGWGGSRDSLRGIGVLFQHTHTVHLVDLPGFGEAAAPPSDWSTINYTDLIQQYVLDRLKGTVVVVGHSFGGRVAVRLAARHLPTVKALVLMGVPGLPQQRFSRRAVRRWWIRTLRRAVIALQPLIGARGVEWHTRSYGSKDYLAAGELRSVFVRVVNEDLSESAAAIDCPTLLLWGTDDAETPPWLAERYREIIGKRAKLELLPRKDHHLYTGTGAHLCGARIRAWMETASV